MTLDSLAQIIHRVPAIQKSMIQHTVGNWKKKGPKDIGEIDEPLYEFRVTLVTEKKCAVGRDFTLRSAVTKAFAQLEMEMPAELSAK